MPKRPNLNYGKDKGNVDLHDIYELIELGLDKEEISKEFGISQKYVKKMMEDFYYDN
ncbi:MAG: hypothetical protein GX987_06880 [Tissierellia bacterium]|nr:hypothetical protein [Tissierellia bacterium]